VVLGANRLGTPNTFHTEELQLLRALANHTSVALDNVRLLGDLRDQALHDALTGLANRTLLLERTEQAIARARRSGSLLAVLLIDLDGFKTINDSLGHAAGAKLLLAVTDRIRACIRPSDTAARLGGDEFGPARRCRRPRGGHQRHRPARARAQRAGHAAQPRGRARWQRRRGRPRRLGGPG
jgi:PleD family two-component response regulator